MAGPMSAHVGSSNSTTCGNDTQVGRTPAAEGSAHVLAVVDEVTPCASLRKGRQGKLPSSWRGSTHARDGRALEVGIADR